MTIFYKFCLFFMALVITTGCSEQPPLAIYKQNSIKVFIKADKNINSFDGIAHTLVLKIYQLNKIQNFQVLVKTKEGLEKLMKAENLDNSFVTNSQFIIIPNEQKELILDRFDDTKFIGIVAGFYEYEDIKKISWHTFIPTDKKYIFVGDEYFKNLKLNLKINRDSIHAQIIEELEKINFKDLEMEDPNE